MEFENFLKILDGFGAKNKYLDIPEKRRPYYYTASPAENINHIDWLENPGYDFWRELYAALCDIPGNDTGKTSLSKMDMSDVTKSIRELTKEVRKIAEELQKLRIKI